MVSKPMFTNPYIDAEDDLLDTSFDLTDKEGGISAAKMKIALSCVSGSVDNIEEFMKKVDDDVGRMKSLPSNLLTLGQVLKSTKAIIDRLTQVHIFQV
jgi:archaellum component FlaC